MSWKKIEGKKPEDIIFWKPQKEGDQIEGKIIGSNPKGIYGLQVDMQTEKGDKYRTPSHRMLQNRLAECRKGQTIRITYLGEEAGKLGQNDMKMYEVEIQE